jgi:hypothetical protein
MRHTATVRVLTSRQAAAQAQGVGRDPLEPRDQGVSPLDPQGIRSVMPVSFDSSVWSMFDGLYALLASL